MPIRGWSVDFDCRERALDDAEDLMVQYATGRDAGAVRVGRSGLDHAGGGLLFIDDDAPCYVRIVGPGREQRAEIARLVADRLTPKTAPMTPVYRRREGGSSGNSSE